MRAQLMAALLSLTGLWAAGQQPVTNASQIKSHHLTTFTAKDGSLTSANMTEKRDMSAYADGGHADCRWFAASRAQESAEEKSTRIASALRSARVFIWDHWQSKKRGYIRITFDSVDATSTSHIFIEPDTNNEWQVTWRIARIGIGMNEVHDVPPIRFVDKKNVGHESVMVFSTADHKEVETL